MPKVYLKIGWLIVRFGGVLVVLMSLFCTTFNGTDVKWKYYLKRNVTLEVYICIYIYNPHRA